MSLFYFLWSFLYEDKRLSVFGSVIFSKMQNSNCLLEKIFEHFNVYSLRCLTTVIKLSKWNTKHCSIFHGSTFQILVRKPVKFYIFHETFSMRMNAYQFLGLGRGSFPKDVKFKLLTGENLQKLKIISSSLSNPGRIIWGRYDSSFISKYAVYTICKNFVCLQHYFTILSFEKWTPRYNILFFI